MFGLKKEYSQEDIQSAHDKQMKKARGQGGIIFTETEKEIIDNHVPLGIAGLPPSDGEE